MCLFLFYSRKSYDTPGDIEHCISMTHTRTVFSGPEAEEDWTSDPELACEPVGSGPIAAGSVKKNAAFGELLSVAHG